MMTITQLPDIEAALRKGESLSNRLADLTPDDLRALTNDMVDAMLAHLAGCTDADVRFQPSDPGAQDPPATDPAEAGQAWTLAHVIVHTTASAEEAAFLAAEMARGIPQHGRSRYEVPWQSLTTIAQCRQRLEESRRMRLASLDMWPDAPHREIVQALGPGTEPLNAMGYFVLGLIHDQDHLGQIAEIVRQAHAARA